MRLLSLRKILSAAAGLVLPALPVISCLAFRGLEAWKLWHEMSRFTALGMIAWMWTLAFLAATLITVGGFDTRQNCRRWERLIDAANTVTSVVLAIDAAKEDVDITDTMPYLVRVLLLFAVCLIAQLTVTFLARRARSVARRMRVQMEKQKAAAAVPTTDMSAAPTPGTTQPSALDTNTTEYELAPLTMSNR
jgi:hypothetical protein